MKVVVLKKRLRRLRNEREGLTKHAGIYSEHKKSH